jgi:hypothetical protein
MKLSMQIADLSRSAVALIGLSLALGAQSSAAQENGSWPMPGENFAGFRYSDLDQINADNVGQLAVAWTFSLGVLRGQGGRADRRGGYDVCGHSVSEHPLRTRPAGILGLAAKAKGPLRESDPVVECTKLVGGAHNHLCRTIMVWTQSYRWPLLGAERTCHGEALTGWS